MGKQEEKFGSAGKWQQRAWQARRQKENCVDRTAQKQCTQKSS